MIRIAVVEDETSVQQMLKDYIDRFSGENDVRFNVTVFADGDEILDEYKPEYDIILLDIQMKRMDGLEASRQIRRIDEDVILIFITHMADFAIQGYAVDAMGFVVKPVSYFAFSEQLKKSIARIDKRKKNYITIRADRGIARLNTAKIYYVESYSHRLILHTENGDYSMNGTMNAMEQQLVPHHFYRCNNCYLINLAHVEKVKQNIVSVSGHELQISRPKRKGFMEALTDYIGGMKR